MFENPFKEYDLCEFLNKIGMKYHVRGSELQLNNCTFCEPNGKKSEHLSFNRQTLQYKCLHCDASGNLITFMRENGHEPFSTKKVYKKPEKEKIEKYQDQPDTYFQSYALARGLQADVIKKYGVGMANHVSLGNCRVYTYKDVSGNIINVKYVNKQKQMLREKDCESIYYGIQFLDFKLDTLHVTEGEDDCHALVGLGYLNVVSVPNGAKSYNEQMTEINKRFKKIVLFFDSDEAGQEGAKKFANKAGCYKCENILLPHKDVRDCVLNGMDKDVFETLPIKKFEYDESIKVRPAMNIVERLERYEKECIKTGAGIKFGFPLIDDITGGLRGGDVFSIVANPGCFKTTTLMNLLDRAAKAKEMTGQFCIFFSLEMSVETVTERELQIYMGVNQPALMRQNAQAKTDWWETFKNEAGKTHAGRILVSEGSNLSIDDIAKTIEETEAATGDRCALIGIDYIDFIDSETSNEYSQVKENMFGVKKKIAKKFNLPVVILAQTSRESKASDTEVSMRSGKGGSAIEATSEFMIGLWRCDDRVVGRFLKHRRIENYPEEYPYFNLDIDKKTYKINKINVSEKPVSTEEKKEEKGKYTRTGKVKG